MSQTFGPYNSSSTPSISAGTVTGIGVNQDAAAVRISNQSLTNDLLVSFAASQPPTVTTVGGGPNWPVVLHPGDRITCTLQNADKTPTALGQFWAGKVWLLPLSTSSQLAQSGTTPSLSNIWISTYQVGEPIPPTDPGPLATASTQQQRVVSVIPAACAGTFSDAGHSWSANGELYLPFPNIIGLPPGGASLYDGSTAVHVYCYWLLIQADSGTWANMELHAVETKADQTTVVTTHKLLNIRLRGTLTSYNPFFFNPVWPLHSKFNPSNQTAYIQYGIKLLGAGSLPFTGMVDAGIDTDRINTSYNVLPSIGGGLSGATTNPYANGQGIF